MGIPTIVFAVILLAVSASASASRPITEKDGVVCLSGQGLPSSNSEGNVSLQVNDMEVLPLNADSHLAAFVDIDAVHLAKFSVKDEPAQTLTIKFNETRNGSVCLRYDPGTLMWSVTPSDKRNMCLDCAPDWVQQQTAYTPPVAE